MTDTKVTVVPRDHAWVADSGMTNLIAGHLHGPFANAVTGILADLLAEGPVEGVVIYAIHPDGDFNMVVAHVGTVTEVDDEQLITFEDGIGVDAERVIALRY